MFRLICNQSEFNFRIFDKPELQLFKLKTVYGKQKVAHYLVCCL